MWWESMTDEQKGEWKSNIEQFYMQRRDAYDLPFDMIADGIFTGGPLKGLSLGAYYLDYGRVAAVRWIAVQIRMRWDTVERVHWRHVRTEAESWDDEHGGFDDLDTEREGSWEMPP